MEEKDFVITDKELARARAFLDVVPIRPLIRGKKNKTQKKNDGDRITIKKTSPADSQGSLF